MGLDWAAAPWPGTNEQENDKEEDYELSPRFRAAKLKTTDLPDYLINKAWHDHTYWEMQAYADELEEALNDEYAEYADEDVTIIEDAIKWLRYWADQRKSLYACY